MSRKAKNVCPGCKHSKSQHSFGKPSSKCSGPSDSLLDDPETVALEKEIKELTLQHNSMLRNKKDQLLAATQALATELDLTPAQSEPTFASSPSTSAKPPSRLNIKDLRKDKDVLKAADNSIEEWLHDSDSSEEEASDTKPRGKKSQISKPQSGSERTGQDDILTPIKWPHLTVLNVDGTEKLRFTDLSVYKLAAGELEIVLELFDSCNFLSKDVKSTDLDELEGRLRRLKDTMYYSVLYDFISAKEYFKQVGLLIERGKNGWKGSFDHLAKWLFRQHSNRTEHNSRSKPNLPTRTSTDDQYNFICGMFNFKEKCKFEIENGKCKRAHICLNCFKIGKTAEHRALDCKPREK